MLNWLTAPAVLNMITVSNSPFGEDAGAMASVPAPPKFKVGEAPERNASAEVVVMMYDVSALPVKEKANIRVQIVAMNELCMDFITSDLFAGWWFIHERLLPGKRAGRARWFGGRNRAGIVGPARKAESRTTRVRRCSWPGEMFWDWSP